MFKVNNVNVRSITDIPVHCTVIPKSSPQPTVVYRVYFVVFSQPRPQGLPRGGARAEEDPGKINTAEKRLRMHQIMKIWRGI